MSTKLSLDTEGYRFIVDGGLAGTVFIFVVGLTLELLDLYLPEFKPFKALFGALAVGILFGMIFCRLAPIWEQDRSSQ